MKALVPVSFACNDPDNGHFSGRIAEICIRDAEFEASNLRGYTFTVEVDGTLRLHGSRFAFERMSEWHGNWCWNCYWLPRRDVKRLLAVMLNRGWVCTAGPSRFCDWYDVKLNR
ncbi:MULTISPECIES: hypothetical protein [Citromicrobium]|uniref:hypothetical protein n=1 Tax=Citromicrobium TaxID=72173 RepID=UPI000ACB167C|nr:MULTISPECIES: hypothetical protein [Citromicrobium]